MIPGIDFAGFVHSSEDPRFHAGTASPADRMGRGGKPLGRTGGARSR